MTADEIYSACVTQALEHLNRQLKAELRAKRSEYEIQYVLRGVPTTSVRFAEYMERSQKLINHNDQKISEVEDKIDNLR